MVQRVRYHWIDWAKFILIALVCLGHFHPSDVQMRLIWGMHMPAFFMISGFLYHPRNAWKTFLSFVIPVFFYSVINLGFYMVEGLLQNGRTDIFDSFYYNIIEPFYFKNANHVTKSIWIFPIWFIWGLMGSRFLAGDIKCFSFILKYKYVTLSILLLWLCIGVLFINDVPLRFFKLYYAIYSLPFFLVGNIMKTSNFKVENLKWWIILPLFAVYVISCYYNDRFDMLSYQYGSNYMIFFITAICGSIVLFWICTKFKENSIVKVFSVGTLLILGLHIHLNWFILPILNRLGLVSSLGQALTAWFCTFIVLFICYWPIKWLMKSCPILLGKLPKK